MAEIDIKLEDNVAIQEVVENTTDVYQLDVDTSSVSEGRLMRRIDFRLLPLLAACYLMNTLDRGAIGNARVCLNAFIVSRD